MVASGGTIMACYSLGARIFGLLTDVMIDLFSDVTISLGRYHQFRLFLNYVYLFGHLGLAQTFDNTAGRF